MARALPNTESRITNLDGITLDGRRRDATHRYLRVQLRELDTRIEALMHVQQQASWRVLERAAWIHPAAAEVVWTGRLELHYLHAVREAMLETLIGL
jgi:hypothetical protein